MTAILSLLTALAPLILSIGAGVISFFIKDHAAASAAQLAFYNAIQTHLNDAVASVTQKTSYQNQIDDMKKQLNNPPPPEAK